MAHQRTAARRGGNGAVFRARRDGDLPEVALKVINSSKAHSEPDRRFVREVEFLRSIGDFSGVLSVIDAYLPVSPNRDDRPWLAMPIATPIASALADATLETVVRAVATLARLAEEHQVGRRDASRAPAPPTTAATRSATSARIRTPVTSTTSLIG